MMIKRFWDKVQIDKPGLCWNWKGAKVGGRYQYGVMRINERNEYTHRISWEIAMGKKVPAGMVIMHTCDNPSCVNPGHLRLGTILENFADAREKGRWRPTGATSTNRKLSDTDVANITLLRTKGLTLSDLARIYSVSPSTVSRICNRSRRGDVSVESNLQDLKGFRAWTRVSHRHRQFVRRVICEAQLIV